MKKFGKISSMLFTFAALANSSFAATTANVTANVTANISTNTTAVSDKGSIANIGTLAVGALLICCVLFIGYKMDKSSDSVAIPKMPKPAKKTNKTSARSIEREDEVNSKGYDEEYEDSSYEMDEYDKYEHDDVDPADLVEDSEYEEDDEMSIFTKNEDIESRFGYEEENLDFENSRNEETTKSVKNTQNSSYTNYSETTVFDSENLNSRLDELDNNEPDDLDYTDAVEVDGLDEKLATLDEVDDSILMSGSSKKKAEEKAKLENSDDAESFMNNLKKYEQMAEEDDFEGFTTKKDSESKNEDEYANVEDTIEESSKRKYTKRKDETESIVEEIPTPSMDEGIQKILGVPDSGVDMGFLAQMESNLKKNQEERLKKNSKSTGEKSTRKKKE